MSEAWKDRGVLVTGGSRGIGLEVARVFARAGAAVVISGRKSGPLRTAVAALEQEGAARVEGIAADVRDPEACRGLVEGARAACGRLDLLVNNAGVGRFAPFHELSAEDWAAQIETNLDAVFHLSRAAVPHLRETRGWIINIGSLASRNSFAGGAAYNASKFGLLGLTEAMMLDLREEGIRVSIVMPGSVATEFNDHVPGPGDEWKLQPADVARAVLDLVSYPSNALASRIELRPSRPRKG